jgi:hypothetical protein
LEFNNDIVQERDCFLSCGKLEYFIDGCFYCVVLNLLTERKSEEYNLYTWPGNEETQKNINAIWIRKSELLFQDR